MNPSPPDAEQIFHEARKLTDPRQRDEYLRRACAGEAGLRARIDALLSAETEAGGFLRTEGPGPGAATPADPDS